MDRFTTRRSPLAMLLLTATLLSAAPLQALEFAGVGELRLNSVPAQTSMEEKKLVVTSRLADAQRQTFSMRFDAEGIPTQITGSRTAVRVKGQHPYSIYFERYEDLGREFVVESVQPLPEGVTVAQYDFQHGGADLHLESAEGQRTRLRVLHAAKRPHGVEIGGPAFVAHSIAAADGQPTQSSPHLVFAEYARMAGFSYMQVEDVHDVFKSKWVNDGQTLYIEWHDQVDKFSFDVDADGRLVFLLERSRGAHQEQVISFGLEPAAQAPRATGTLIGHWTFDQLEGGRYRDHSGRNHYAVPSGGMQPIAAMKGQGIYGVRCAGVPLGVAIATDADKKVPGKLEFGKVTLPKQVLEPIKDAMTVSFWYAQPEFVEHGFGGYIEQQKAYEGEGGGIIQWPFKADGFLTLYNMWNFLDGQKITADGLGNHRLFGMYGPKQPRGFWSFYTVVIDGNMARLYINGELKMESEGKHTLAESPRNFDEIVLMQNMWGTMDELKIYDYPLDVNAMKDEFQNSQSQEILWLNFEGGLEQRAGKQVVVDARSNPHLCSGVEIVPSKVGKGLRFGRQGGKVEMPHTINSGKQLPVFTFAAWVKTPVNFDDRCLFFSSQTGHAGFQLGAWKKRFWGSASLNNPIVADLTPGEWTHVIASYGYNRLSVWINGQLTVDNPEAYPSAKGWNVSERPYFLGFDQALELDEVRLLSFRPDNETVAALLNSLPVNVPEQQSSGAVVHEVIRAQWQ